MRFFPTTVVDDFFPDPDVISDLARNVEYSEKELQFFPGNVSKERLHQIDRSIYEFVLDKIVTLFWDPQYHNLTCDCRMDFQKIEPYPDKDHLLNKGTIHSDIQSVSLAGVIYLNKNPSKDSGTSIYEINNPYYLPRKDYKDALERYNRGDDVEDIDKIFQEHYDNFEESVRIQNKYNRLVLYSPELWHSATTFGEQTRHTLRIFINYMGSKDQNYPLARR